jgi:1-acyl-sn-glycerol-3-phosphate acyltransferase
MAPTEFRLRAAPYCRNPSAAIDPPLVGSFSPRAIFYIAKAEILEMPVVGEALAWTGGFPARRGESDREGCAQPVISCARARPRFHRRRTPRRVRGA